MTPDRVNRAVLTLWGVVFGAAGAAILVVGLGAFGSAVAGQAVIDTAAAGMVTGHDRWAWTAVVVAGVTVALVGLWWLWKQAQADRMRRVDLEPDRGHGWVRLSAQALVDAVDTELEKIPDVQNARVRLVRRRRGPQLHLTVRLNPHGDPDEVRHHVETAAIAHARQAVAPDPLPARMRLEIARSGGRVR